MRGQITVCADDQIQHFALSAGATRIGSAPDADLRGARLEPQHARLEWDARASAWTLAAATPQASATLRVNGVAAAATTYLQNGDIIEMPDLFIRFLWLPDPPRHRGRETEEIRLHGLRRLVFGRAAGAEEDEADKVALDAADTSISRVHVVLEKDAEGHFVARDESQTGTLLNGQHFSSQRLTVGDRFGVGSYHFEFTGYSVRRVERMSGGKLEARHLTVQVKSGKTILNDVSLDIERCSFVGILGGSGQGKSTLLTAMCGISPATSGSVYLNGRKLSDPRELAAAGVGYVPQDDIVHIEITVEQALRYSARLRLPAETPPRALEALVSETIDRLGLGEHRTKRIHQLSGGQRKRVSIATELLAKPSVLFLDEPSSGLDPATEFQLMSLLRRLAAKDCTVVCTTHVLGRAYLFDQVTFVHGGHVVFHGDPAEALPYFGVESLDEIYLKLAEDGKSGAEWRQQFEAQIGSEEKPDFGNLAPDGGGAAPRRAPGSGYWRSLIVLLRRQWSILQADPLNLVFLLAQPLMIAGLVGWVADDAVLRMFLCVVATLWFGCSNGAQQIVRELAVFRRERLCGLGLHAYLQSKYLFLGAVTAFQALLLYGVTLTIGGWIHPMDINEDLFRQRMAEICYPPPAASDASAAETVEFDVITEDDPAAAAATATADSGMDLEAVMQEEERRKKSLPVELLVRAGTFFEVANNLMDATQKPSGQGHDTGVDRELGVARVLIFTIGLKLLALLATAAVGVAIGLAISALVQNSTQAVLWVPLVLIPQILFGGFVVTRPEMTPSVRAASVAIPSHAAQRVIDVSNLYGQTTPRMSNRTKYPVFLTPGGDQETVEWEEAGETVNEKYDKISEHNNSWQNLLVYPSHAGEHRHVYRRSQGKKIYDDSVEERSDVRYRMGILYLHLGQAVYGLTALFAWVALCYAATWLGLLLKQRGR